MPGPGKKPAQLKVLSGTTQPCREGPEPIDLPAVDEVPPPPDWLPNAHAVKEWERLAPVLFSVGLLTKPGLAALGHLCALHGKMVQLWAAGETPTGHMVAQYRALVNDFGLTPVAQGKVRSGGDKAKGNRFAKFKRA